MSRDLRLYLEDIREYGREILDDTEGLSFQEFLTDRRRYKASHTVCWSWERPRSTSPSRVRARYPAVEWSKIAGMRDIPAHRYFALDDRIMWDAARSNVPALIEQVNRMLDDLA